MAEVRALLLQEEFESIKMKSRFKFKVIKYFHPTGKSMPNGIGYQRGWFLKECRDNMNSFTYEIPPRCIRSSLRGGVILFPYNVNAAVAGKDDCNPDIHTVEKVVKQALHVDDRHRHFCHYSFKGKITGLIRQWLIIRQKNVSVIAGKGHAFTGLYPCSNGCVFNEDSVSLEIQGISPGRMLKLAGLLRRTFNQESVLVRSLNNGKTYLYSENT